MIKFGLAAILIIHTLLLTSLQFFPYPELFIYPYLTNNGLLPYKEILDQHFPGLLFLPINFDNLGMNDEFIARIWLIGIVLIIHLFLFFITRSILKSDKKALLINFLYLLWQPFFEGWVLWIDNFLPLILLPAYFFLYKGKFFVAGLFMGIAVVFKQVMIPLSVAIPIYLFWKNRNLKEVGKYLLGLLSPIVLMLAYFIGIGVFKDFWYWTVSFNLTEYAKYGRGSPPSTAHFLRVALVFGTSLLILKKIKLKEVQLLVIFLLGTLVGLSTRFDFVHFQPALPFALIATVYVLNYLKKNLAFKTIMIMYILVSLWWFNIFYKGHLSGKVFFFDEQNKLLVSKIQQNTKFYEKIFVFGLPPHLYQMSSTLPAGNIFVFQFPWFLKVAEERILEGLMKDQPNIIVSDREAEIEGEKIKDFAKKIDNYIQQNYEELDRVGNTLILHRKQL